MSAQTIPSCTLSLPVETLSAWHDGALDAAETQRVGAHAETCPGCRARLAAYERAGRALRMQQPPEPGDQLWRDVQHSFIAVPRDPETTRGRRRLLGGMGALAAVLLLAVGFAQVFHAHTPPTGGPPASVPTQSVHIEPVATPGPQMRYVPLVTTAAGVDDHLAPIDPTARFQPGMTVYLVASVRGAPAGHEHTITVRWFIDGQDTEIPPSISMKTVSGDANVYFTLTYPVAGVGMAKVYFDAPPVSTVSAPSDQYLAATVVFLVQQGGPPAPRS